MPEINADMTDGPSNAQILGIGNKKENTIEDIFYAERCLRSALGEIKSKRKKSWQSEKSFIREKIEKAYKALGIKPPDNIASMSQKDLVKHARDFKEGIDGIVEVNDKDRDVLEEYAWNERHKFLARNGPTVKAGAKLITFALTLPAMIFSLRMFASSLKDIWEAIKIEGIGIPKPTRVKWKAEKLKKEVQQQLDKLRSSTPGLEAEVSASKDEDEVEDSSLGDEAEAAEIAAEEASAEAAPAEVTEEAPPAEEAPPSGSSIVSAPSELVEGAISDPLIPLETSSDAAPGPPHVSFDLPE